MKVETNKQQRAFPIKKPKIKEETPAYKQKVKVQIKPTIDPKKQIIVKKEETKKTRLEQFAKLMQKQKQNEEEARNYLRSLKIESYTISFVPGKGVVTRGISSRTHKLSVLR